MSKKIIDQLTKVKSEAIRLFKNKKYIESLKFLEKAIQISPSDLELLFYEALCLYHLGNIDQASLIIEQLYEMDTDNILPLLPKICSIILLKNNKFKKAEVIINNCLKKNPHDSQFLNMLGYTYEKNGRKLDAKKTYKRILTLDRDNTNACNALAYLYIPDREKHTEANDLIKKALEREPNNYAYLDTFGMLQIAVGNFKAGLQQLKAALSYSPGNQTILSHINEAVNHFS